MEKPREYKKGEVEELVLWFKQHKDELPESMQVNKYISTSNLRRTVDALSEVVLVHWRDPYFAGQIHCLEEIRARILEKQG